MNSQLLESGANMPAKYIFDEDKLIEEIKTYVDNTYSEHYAGGIQVAEFILSNCDSPDFYRGNILKYIARYGHKNGHDRKDLLKAIHYLFMLLSYHDRKYGPKGPPYTMEDVLDIPSKIGEKV